MEVYWPSFQTQEVPNIKTQHWVWFGKSIYLNTPLVFTMTLHHHLLKVYYPSPLTLRKKPYCIYTSPSFNSITPICLQFHFIILHHLFLHRTACLSHLHIIVLKIPHPFVRSGFPLSPSLSSSSSSSSWSFPILVRLHLFSTPSYLSVAYHKMGHST